MLFASGYAGAYAFPVVAPLAQVSKSYKCDELKVLAHELRNMTLLKDGKITSSGTAKALCPKAGMGEGTSFFGPLLDLLPIENISGLNSDKVLFIFPRPILCAAILSNEKNEPLSNEKLLFPKVSFRAAMIANLTLRPLGGGVAPYSYEWRLGPSSWLPAYKRAKSL
jgi:hypothetical protein